MRQRYYNPEIKRFINQDIITGSIGNSQSLNRYCYVQGNPVSMTDPFGLFPLAFNGKELLHAFLNVAGMAPGILGTMADVANAAMYAMEGDVASAISCGISALPAVGNIIAGGMLAVKGGKALKTANYVRNICGLIGNGATFLRSGAAAISGAVDVVQHYIETGDVDWAGIGAVGLNMFAAKSSASAVLSNGNSLRKMLSEDNVAGKIKKSFGNVAGKIKSGFGNVIEKANNGICKLKNDIVTYGKKIISKNSWTKKSKSWYKKNGAVNYPPNNGAVVGTEKEITLNVGDTIGRYGNIGDFSTFVTQTGVPSEKLSLPPNTNPEIYQEFIVKKPIPEVIQAEIAPWGDDMGGGIQFNLPHTLKWLIENDYLSKK